MGSNPSTVYWMDLLSIDLLLKFIICLKRPKINEKEAGVDPFFFKKRNLFKVNIRESGLCTSNETNQTKFFTSHFQNFKLNENC